MSAASERAMYLRRAEVSDSADAYVWSGCGPTAV
jgi:hypothetical protein